MVRRPAYGPRFDVVQLAACAWAPSLVKLSILKEILLVIYPYSRDGAVVFDRDERQHPQTGDGGHDVDDRMWFGPIQLLCFALIGLPPPRGGIPLFTEILGISPIFGDFAKFFPKFPQISPNLFWEIIPTTA
jgi:hypothetical protein